jgi:hypothetical protein
VNAGASSEGSMLALLGRNRCRAALTAIVLAASVAPRAAAADPIPPGWEASKLEPVGYSGVDNRKGAFKIALKKVNGRWYMYVGHLWHFGWSILDVTDPRDPKFVKFLAGADNTWNIQVTLHDKNWASGF